MSILTVTVASVLIAVSAVNATLQYVQLERRANKRHSAGSIWRELSSEQGILLRTSLVSLCYGEWMLVKSATGSSSLAAWLITGIEAAILAWVVWDLGVWIKSNIRRSRGMARPSR